MLSGRAVIVTGAGVGFPVGLAPTQRVRYYARMLQHTGLDVQVLCADPSMSDDGATVPPSQGAEAGVAYRYAGGSPVRSRWFVARRFRALRSWSLVLWTILRIRPQVVLAYPMTTAVSILLVPLAHAVGSVVVCDQSELPSVHAGPGLRGRVRLFWRWSGLRRADGIVAISPGILSDLSAKVGPGHLLLLPVVIDTELVSAPAAPRPDSRDIVYTGRLNEHKDGTATLLDAFSLVARATSDADLVLAGEADPGVLEAYRLRARELGVESSVHFVGRLSRPDLEAQLRSATVLVLPRPDTPQNRANMPTKLIEYLSTGRPVVATAVGTVAETLVDGRDARLCQPNAPAIAEAILAVLNDSVAAEEMAARGRQLAVRRWDYRAHMDCFGGFVRSLVEPRSACGTVPHQQYPSREEIPK